jgi:hypothetical protein
MPLALLGSFQEVDRGNRLPSWMFLDSTCHLFFIFLFFFILILQGMGRFHCVISSESN